MPTQDAPDFAQPLSGIGRQQNVVVSSTTTLAVPVQHNDVTVGAEQTLDLEDGTGVVFAVTDDSGNGRIKVTPSLNVTAGTSFPGSPVDGQEYIYVADATNGVFWRMRYYTSGGYWAYLGGPPLFAEVTTSETTASGAYTSLTTPGPSVALPFAADYIVEVGADITGGTTFIGAMSYAIGGTAATDNDSCQSSDPLGSTAMRRRLKTGLSAVTLSAAYRSSGGGTAAFAERWISVHPVKK